MNLWHMEENLRPVMIEIQMDRGGMSKCVIYVCSILSEANTLRGHVALG